MNGKTVKKIRKYAKAMDFVSGELAYLKNEYKKLTPIQKELFLKKIKSF